MRNIPKDFAVHNWEEELCHPVILLSDEVVAHSREPVSFSHDEIRSIKRKFAEPNDPSFGGFDDYGHSLMPRFGDGHRLLVTGSTHDNQGFRKTADPEVHDSLVRRLTEKITANLDIITDVIVSGPNRSKWGIISFGSTSRTVDEVMQDMGHSKTIRSLRLRTIWPFPGPARLPAVRSRPRPVQPGRPDCQPGRFFNRPG